MKVYNCERCGYTTSRRSNFNFHLKRKNICLPNLSNINIETIREKHMMYNDKTINNYCSEKNLCNQNVTVGEKKFKCKYCELMFLKRQHKWRHEKYNCKVKKEKDIMNEKDNVIIELTKLKEERAELKKENAVLKAERVVLEEEFTKKEDFIIMIIKSKEEEIKSLKEDNILLKQIILRKIHNDVV